MHRFTEFQPQIAESKFGYEPSLFDIIAGYYDEMDDPIEAADQYMAGWIALETAWLDEEEVSWKGEVSAVLRLLDGLADVWGDEAVFRRCRDRLRNLLRP